MENPPILTWSYKDIAFPQLSSMRETGAVPAAPDCAFTLSIDFQEESVWYVKDALSSRRLEHPAGVHINPLSRRSYANCGYDKLQAWDVTLLRSSFEDDAEVVWEVWSLLRLQATRWPSGPDEFGWDE